MKNDFVPRKENDLLVWHDKFMAGTTAHGTALGLTAADLAAIVTDNENLHADIGASSIADGNAKSATGIKNSTIKRVVAASRGYARRMKDTPAYDPAIGDTMGIEGPEDTTNLATSKPTLKCTVKPGAEVEIAFNKSTSDGVNLYCQREGEAQPVFLARDTHSPYLDNRPLLIAGKPENRRYHAIYVVSDAQIGEASDEVNVAVRP